ncbi:MAG: putative Bug-like extra-cytoplasmic solute receptor, family [Polaromonas sp.]|nr:putative Bug-like extra-cytoplasmic solute receptor, family [Polaromonas sp.]
MPSKNTFTRKAFTTALLAGLASAATTGALAQTAAADPFPSKPVTIVTPFAPGSGPDAVMRLLGEVLAKKWNQRVVVDNRPGGGGFIAIDVAKRAAPDGYTLIMLDSEHVSALPHLYKQRGFRTLDAFDPVAVIFRTPFLVAVSAESKYKTMADLIAGAKAANGNTTYGSWGVGSPGHLGGVMLEGLSGLKMQHVAYRDVGQLYISVSTGDVNWSLGSIPSSRPAFQSGKLRYLAVAAPKRIPQMPDVPTVAESGGPAKFEVSSFVMLLAPKGMPDALAQKINADVAQAIADPAVRARYDSFAFEPLSWSKADILANAQAKSATYQQLVQQGNISLD